MRECRACGKTFRPGGGSSHYCSRECGISARSGENHWLYRGGSINKGGYRLICVDGKRVLEHRHVMALHIGRPLLPSEVVHHKDHDRLNNAIENLELVESRSRHKLMHYTGYRTETHKQCRKCHQINPRTEFDAGRKKPGCDPNHTECKACRAAYYAERWKAGLTSAQKTK